MIQPSEILFCGIGRSSVLWYRCALPALHLGADWVGVRGEPPGLQMLTGLVRGNTSLPRFEDYRVVILQQVHGRAWLKTINRLRAQGIRVLYEIDDYLHGVAKIKGHDSRTYLTRQRLLEWEMCMRACDGLIVSTDYIGRRYRKFNPNVYVCANGIDLGRYALTRPERSTVNIGWAGATGHVQAILNWMPAVLETMTDHDDTTLVVIGHPGLVHAAWQKFGEQRAIGIPFTALECYPAAMTMFDIALAPATNAGWYRGKSDLRWLEASALGIATIADPNVYPSIEHGVTGFHAETPAQVRECLERLVTNPQLRVEMGEAAREYIKRERTSDIAAAQWFEVCGAVVGEYESAAQVR